MPPQVEWERLPFNSPDGKALGHRNGFSENHALLRELGADVLIDYKQTRFEDVAQVVDVVLDALGGDTQARSWQTLKPGGILVASDGAFLHAACRAEPASPGGICTA